MYTTQIQKWGNSQAIRIPKPLLDTIMLNINDTVEISINGNKIEIAKAKQHKSLRERFADYTEDFKVQEWDTGSPTGKECIDE